MSVSQKRVAQGLVPVPLLVFAPKLQQLTDEAYRCYSARETDSYFEVVKKVKDATEFSQYQETYYRAVEEFVGDAEPNDDLTKMCIKMQA